MRLYKDAQEGAFEAEIKGALEVTIEFHLKMPMVVHLFGHRSTKNDSINGEIEGALYVTLERKRTISL